MAKMFYSLEETAQQLGVDVNRVMEMVTQGQLQQFRDRDKLMFKRDQVNALSGSSSGGDDESTADDELDEHAIPLLEDDVDDPFATEPGPDEAGATEPREPGVLGDQMSDISLSDTGKFQSSDIAGHGEDDLASDEPTEPTTPDEQIGLLNQDDQETADPSSQTLVANPLADDEELVLDSIGSGSGLLDLTHESDDTSLGAELLDEIYPRSGEDSSMKMDLSPGGSSGMAEGAIAMDFGSTTGLENLHESADSVAAVAVASPGAVGSESTYDPAGSMMSAGILAGTTISLVIALIVTIFALTGVSGSLTAAIAANPAAYTGGLLFACMALGGVGFFVGKSHQ